MPSIYDLKPVFQNLLLPTVRVLSAHGVTANQVTLFAVTGSVLLGATAAALPTNRPVLAALPLWLLIRMALNAIDGMLAREYRQASPLGALLNEIGDLISDAALYLPLALVPGLPPALVVSAVVLALVSEATGIAGVQIGASRRYDGPMGKSDRAFVLGLLALLLAAGVDAGAWSATLLTLVNVLLVVTVINRARRALGEVTA